MGVDQVEYLDDRTGRHTPKPPSPLRAAVFDSTGKVHLHLPHMGSRDKARAGAGRIFHEVVALTSPPKEPEACKRLSPRPFVDVLHLCITLCLNSRGFEAVFRMYDILISRIYMARRFSVGEELWPQKQLPGAIIETRPSFDTGPLAGTTGTNFWRFHNQPRRSCLRR